MSGVNHFLRNKNQNTRDEIARVTEAHVIFLIFLHFFVFLINNSLVGDFRDKIGQTLLLLITQSVFAALFIHSKFRAFENNETFAII